MHAILIGLVEAALAAAKGAVAALPTIRTLHDPPPDRGRRRRRRRRPRQ
jgi:hypothetical protein